MPRRHLHLILAVAGLAVITTALVAAIGFSNARADPIVRRATIVLPRWPAGAGAVTVVLISDIHIGSATMDAERLTRLADDITALRPDLILIAGDFVSGHDPDGAVRLAPAMEAPLRRLHAPLGVVAVLGNHDHWTGAERVHTALRTAGIIVLDNAAIRAGPLALGGIGDHFTGHDRVGRTVAAMRSIGGVPLALTHGADLVDDLPSDVRLLLAGHTHCGQVVLFGRAVGAQPYDPRYRCGLVRDHGRVVVVTGGLGTSVASFRIGAPPDLWLLTLRGR